jgi:WD40 repeat protein
LTEALVDCDEALRRDPHCAAAFLQRSRLYLLQADRGRAGPAAASAPLGGEVRRLSGQPGRVSRAILSPDGRRLLWVSESRGQTLTLWDMAAGKPLRSLEGHATPVSEAVFLSDSRRAVAREAGGGAILWDVETGKVLRRSEPSWGEALAVAPDGRRLVTRTADGKTLRLLDLDPDGSGWGRELRPFEGHTAKVARAILFAGGHRLYSACPERTGTYRIWDADTGKEVWRRNGPEKVVEAGQICFSPGGAQAAISDLAPPGGARPLPPGRPPPGVDPALTLWDVAAARPLCYFLAANQGVYATALAFSADGHLLLSGGPVGTVRLWDVAGGAELHHFEGHAGPVVSVAFFADGLNFLSAGQDGTVRLWRLPLTRARALEDLAVAARLEPKSPLPLVAQGTWHLQDQRPGEALADFTEAIRRDADCADAYRLRAGIYLQAKDYPKALADLSDAIRADSRRGAAYYQRGVIYADQGEYARAKADLDRAFRLDPSLFEKKK